MNKRLRIYADRHPSSPREWDNLCTMVCKHNRYTLGDKEFAASQANNWREHVAEYFLENYSTGVDEEDFEVAVEKVYEWINDNVIIKPLYLYDHSGQTISTSPFSCRWDSGQVGFIYCTLEQAEKNFTVVDGMVKEWYGKNEGQMIPLKDVVERCMEGEVETYDQYLRGDVYGFLVEEWNPEVGCGWETVDSCGGFYGSDMKENGILDYIPEELHHLVDEVEIEY